MMMQKFDLRDDAQKKACEAMSEKMLCFAGAISCDSIDVQMSMTGCDSALIVESEDVAEFADVMTCVEKLMEEQGEALKNYSKILFGVMASAKVKFEVSKLDQFQDWVRNVTDPLCDIIWGCDAHAYIEGFVLRVLACK